MLQKAKKRSVFLGVVNFSQPLWMLFGEHISTPGTLLPECTPFFSFQEAFHRFSKWCGGTFVNVLKYEWDFKNIKLLRKTLNYCTKIDETGKPYSNIYVIYTQTFMSCIYKCASIYLHIYIYCIYIARYVSIHSMIKYVLMINYGC